MTIAKKTLTPYPWLAWIPLANIYLVTQIIGIPGVATPVILLGSLFPTLFSFVGFPVIGIIIFLIFALFVSWKLVEACHYSGWFSLLLFIPLVNLIFLGVLAWGKELDHQRVLDNKEIRFYQKNTFWIILLVVFILLSTILVIMGISKLSEYTSLTLTSEDGQEFSGSEESSGSFELDNQQELSFGTSIPEPECSTSNACEENFQCIYPQCISNSFLEDLSDCINNKCSGECMNCDDNEYSCIHSSSPPLDNKCIECFADMQCNSGYTCKAYTCVEEEE